MSKIIHIYLVALPMAKDVIQPCQPTLTQYDRKKCGAEKTTRDFNPEWYKTYPWLSYETAEKRCVCFPCQKFIDGRFQFTNWKKPERLKSTRNVANMNWL